VFYSSIANVNIRSLSSFVTPQFENILKTAEENGIVVVKRFFGLLKFLTIHQAKKHFVPTVLNFCNMVVLPALGKINDPPEDVVTFFSELCYQLLLDLRSITDPTTITSLLRFLISNFLRKDIRIFKVTINYITELNTKVRLFTLEVFKPLQNELLRNLFNTLLVKSHDLLSDQIYSLICKLAQEDSGSFLQFLYEYLSLENKLSDVEKQSLYSILEKPITVSKVPLVSQVQQFITDYLVNIRRIPTN